MNPIYRGQYPPKNTDVLWIKNNQIYIYQNGGWKATSGETADWNASEGESGYVKNRPFYTETKTSIHNMGDGSSYALQPKFSVGETTTDIVLLHSGQIGRLSMQVPKEQMFSVIFNYGTENITINGNDFSVDIPCQDAIVLGNVKCVEKEGKNTVFDIAYKVIPVAFMTTDNTNNTLVELPDDIFSNEIYIRYGLLYYILSKAYPNLDWSDPSSAAASLSEEDALSAIREFMSANRFKIGDSDMGYGAYINNESEDQDSFKNGTSLYVSNITDKLKDYFTIEGKTTWREDNRLIINNLSDCYSIEDYIMGMGFRADANNHCLRMSPVLFDLNNSGIYNELTSEEEDEVYDKQDYAKYEYIGITSLGSAESTETTVHKIDSVYLPDTGMVLNTPRIVGTIPAEATIVGKDLPIIEISFETDLAFYSGRVYVDIDIPYVAQAMLTQAVGSSNNAYALINFDCFKIKTSTSSSSSMFGGTWVDVTKGTNVAIQNSGEGATLEITNMEYIYNGSSSSRCRVYYTIEADRTVRAFVIMRLFPDGNAWNGAM